MSCSENKYKIFTLLKYSSGEDIHVSFYIGQKSARIPDWKHVLNKFGLWGGTILLV